MYSGATEDGWYASSWYNGPQTVVQRPPALPSSDTRALLRHPPAAWAGWQRDAPPRWGERWGQYWEQHRKGWDQWDRHTTQARAPLPVYQRQYSGNRYPREEQQQALLRDKYRYQPKEPVVREHYQQHAALPQSGERKPQPNQRSSAPPPQQGVRPVSHSQPAQGQGTAFNGRARLRLTKEARVSVRRSRNQRWPAWQQAPVMASKIDRKAGQDRADTRSLSTARAGSGAKGASTTSNSKND
jgi:hypothetical protein